MTIEELRAKATVLVGDKNHHTWPGPYGTMSVTLEDAELLYALVRLAKPDRVLELGTGLGVSARFIGEALAANRRGVLWTVEPDKDIRTRAGELLDGLETVRQASSSAGLQDTPLDVVFIDSGYLLRENDINQWVRNGFMNGDGALVLVHDANRDYTKLRGAGVLIPGSDGLWIGRAP